MLCCPYVNKQPTRNRNIAFWALQFRLPSDMASVFSAHALMTCITRHLATLAEKRFGSQALSDYSGNIMDMPPQAMLEHGAAGPLWTFLHFTLRAITLNHRHCLHRAEGPGSKCVNSNSNPHSKGKKIYCYCRQWGIEIVNYDRRVKLASYWDRWRM